MIQLRFENDTKNVDDDWKPRVEKLEQLSKVKVLRTCQEYSERGITKSGIFTIDPDGDGVGFGPVDAYCNFQTNETSIFHDKEDIIKVCNWINYIRR